jgi:hypothetical protein
LLRLTPSRGQSFGTGPRCVAFSPDGKVVAGGSDDGRIALWQTATGKRLRQFWTNKGKPTASLAFSPDGKILFSGLPGRVDCWEVRSGKRLRRLVLPDVLDPEETPGTDFNPPQMLAVSPDGRLLAVACGYPDVVCFYELATLTLRQRLPRTRRPAFGQHPTTGVGEVKSGPDYGSPFLAFAPDSRVVAWNRPSGIQLWDLARAREVRLFGGLGGEIKGVVFSPCGGFLAAASSAGTVRFWDPRRGTLLGEIRAPRGGFSSLAISPDGKTLYTGGSDTTVLLWDLGRIQARWRLRPPALSKQKLTKLWDCLASAKGTEAGKAIRRLQTNPHQAVGLLGGRLRPVARVDSGRIARLITTLESKRFRERNQARKDLEKLAELAEPQLRQRLAENPPLEVRQRVVQLLKKLSGVANRTELLRSLRAVEVLERIGTPEARRVLRSLAKGAPTAKLTREAKAALKRLGRSPGPIP